MNGDPTAVEGEPEMVTTLAAQLPVTPAGRPVTVAPVAPVVAYVILVIGVLTATVCVLVPGAEVRDTVLVADTVMVPVALMLPQPPVKGML